MAFQTLDTAVLERDTELASLASAFSDAADGCGRVVVLEGPAGEGKSTLLAAACQGALESGLTVLGARGGELEREFPFGVMRQLFEPVLARADEGRLAALLDGAAGPGARVLGLGAEDDAGAVEPGAGTFHALYWLTANVAAESPAVLAVDDAHWSDASSLRALDYIARRIADLPVALVVALRPDEPEAHTALLDELKTTPDAVRLRVRPLGPQSAAEIIRTRFPDADQETCDAAHEATAGNPFYLQELLRSLPPDESGAGVESALIASMAIPSLGERVIRRIGRVAPEAQALARSMAVLGDGSRLGLAAELAGTEELPAGQIAHRLRRIEVLSAEDPFRFVHPLVRQSVYDSMSVTQRASVHQAASEVLTRHGAPAETIALHLAALTPAGSAEVARTIVRAAERAASRGATDEAVGWFRRALEEGAAEPPPAVILTGLGLNEAALRDPQAIEHLRQALADAEDLGLRAHIGSSLADLLVLAGEWSDALEVVRSVRTTLTEEDDAFAHMAAIELMLATYSPGLGAGFDLDPTRLHQLSEGTSWASRALAAALAVRAAHQGADSREVVRLVDLALADDLLVNEVGGGRWPIANVLIALTDIDEYERALSVSDAMRAVARPSGSLTTEILASDHRGWIYARRGDLAAAEAELRPGLAMAHGAGLVTVVATQLFYLQEALIERDSLADIAQIAETLEPGRGAEGTWPAAALAMVRGRLRLLRREENGLEDLRQAAELAQALHLSPSVWPVRSVLALALPASEGDEALALVDEELALARATGLPRPEGVALRAAARIAPDQQGIELLRESVAVLARSPARLEHGRSLVELGSALRRTGRRADARDPLTEGLALARDGGAFRLARRAAEELRAAGGRRAANVVIGRDSLTASELRVARLAAEGASNAEVAQELLVSLKTVETHLSSVYAKLGLSGRGARRRLAEALAAG